MSLSIDEVTGRERSSHGSKVSFITSKWQSQNSNQACPMSKPALSNTFLYTLESHVTRRLGSRVAV